MKVGDKVKWINESMRGVVKEVAGSRLKVLLENGFEEEVAASKVVIDCPLDFSIENSNEEKHLNLIYERKSIQIEEIDLHIENLTVHWASIPKNKILERQLTTFYEEFQTCRRNRVDKLIVIHGKGEGILRRNIIAYLLQYPNFTFSDMTEGKYKGAAIEISFNIS